MKYLIALLALTSPAWMLAIMIKWEQYTERRQRAKMEQYGPKATTH